MKAKDVSEMMKKVYTEDEIDRVDIKTTEDGAVSSMIVNVHEMTVEQAKRFLNNLIAMTKTAFSIKVIHGYNHGTAIMQMVNTNMNNKRIVGYERIPYNPGITILDIAPRTYVV